MRTYITTIYYTSSTKLLLPNIGCNNSITCLFILSIIIKKHFFRYHVLHILSM